MTDGTRGCARWIFDGGYWIEDVALGPNLKLTRLSVKPAQNKRRLLLRICVDDLLGLADRVLGRFLDATVELKQ